MRPFLQLAVVAVSGMAFVNQAGAGEQPIPLDKLPKAVTDAVKKLYPKAELIEAAQEEEDKKIEYEVTVKLDGKRIDITVEADGKIETLEKEIDFKDLPKAVIEALAKTHPKAVYKMVEAVYEFEEGKEVFEFYEVQLETADKKKMEVKVAADGKIIADADDDDDDKE